MTSSFVPLMDLFTIRNILEWWFITFWIGMAAMGLDKGIAKTGSSNRISERALWMVGFAGGFLGIIGGGLIFSHKTRKPGFWVPVALATLIWGAIFLYQLRPW
jgi:uncharacterized membrane protein YsdA (DUF1294 family)